MMDAYGMTSEQITAYGANLHMEERCEATVQKYVSAVMARFRFLPPEKTVTRELLLAWKAEISARFSASGANVMISAVNRFCAFMSKEQTGGGNPLGQALSGANRPASPDWMISLTADAGTDFLRF